MEEIKPCPFCGCRFDKDEEDVYYTGDHEAWCPLGDNRRKWIEIGASGIMFTKHDIENWNRRAEI